MKHSIKLVSQLLMMSLLSIDFMAVAQLSPIQYFRPNNKNGLNIFETTKNDTTLFTGMKVRIGGNFAQDFQALDHQNNALPVYTAGVNTNQLIGLNPGFNLAMANLNLDVQLEDGIRMSLTMYLSSRHHPETWVKGGYIQFDKLLFLKSRLIDSMMKNITLKVGAFEIDYGDQHFRRTDGGNTIYNPFIENYIMDEFATEIGGEIYFHPKNGLIVMAGISNGQLNPTVVAPTKIDSATGKLNKYPPAFHAKIGYDKQFTDDLRFRIMGSVYGVKSAAGNSLFNGDRTGSHYFLVMENTLANSADNAFSGRYNPRFSQQVLTFMINPFFTYKGIELFGTYEMARGRVITEKEMRSATQYAVDVLYRFPQQRKNFWIGARYNVVSAEPTLNSTHVTISRYVGSLGWFLTKNIMLKAEYVNQFYQGFSANDIRSGGKFNGFMMEASVGF